MAARTTRGHDPAVHRTRGTRASRITRTAALLAIVACACAAGAGAGGARAPGTVRAGAWIAYQGSGGIHLVHPDGTGDRLLGARPAGEQGHPDWSPDGRTLVLDLDVRSLWTVDVATGRARQVYECTAPCYFLQDGAWSPDGRSIAFVRADADDTGATTARSSIIVLDVARGAARTVWEVTNGTDLDFAPRWSPDGTRLVFELDRFVDTSTATTEISGARLGVVPASGRGRPTWLTGFAALATFPDWNRRTGRIVYAAGSRGIPDHPGDPSDLFTVSPDGTGRRRLTHYRPSVARATQPTWTSDGSRILFTYVRGTGAGRPVIASVAPDGSGLDARPDAAQPQTHPRQQP